MTKREDQIVTGKLTVGSLFSGAGLCDLGLQWAGFEHKFFCEISPFCRQLLAKHWPGVPIFEDVKKLSGELLPAVDVLCGGFPCQDVSNSGRRAGIKEGTRSGLWKEYARLINELKPKYAIIENVIGLLSRGIENVLQDMASLGYNAEWEVLPAATLGAPHHRERVFIIAYANGNDTNLPAYLFSPLSRIVGDKNRPRGIHSWQGLSFDRQRKEAAWKIYPEPVLYRMDDGDTEELDKITPRVSADIAATWHNRIRVLGNAITPQQAYAVGSCIMAAEGYTAHPMPVLQWGQTME